MSRILVTGATGFVGRALLPALTAAGHEVRATARRPDAPLPPGVERVAIGDLAEPVDWRPALEGVEAVIHAAGQAHAEAGEDVHRRVGLEATAQLAAAAAGRVGRLVFLSSIRAQTGPVAEDTVTSSTPDAPTDAYGRMKLAAEDALLSTPDLPAVVLRPVLVHGPGVGGNLARLARLARSPLPLPLGLARARRSLVARDHLVDAVLLGLVHPGAVGRRLAVADPDPPTVAEVVAALRAGLGRRPGLLPVPMPLLTAAARLVGASDALSRLTGPLVVDAAPLAALGWRPRRPTLLALQDVVSGATRDS